ncbi:TfoX/Sxy family protein [Litoribrevibacter euphylliae]|uniref:TfoX/Sxy family protein n=1 Tax=Litoribrevibacter euphylliae TaxID=1834034 RepID=A0ABV7HGN3_9GAMM
MGELSKLKGLGPKSEQWLNEIGIFTEAELRELGAVATFMKLRHECSVQPSLNFLYAMVGALENVSWTKIAREEKGRLLIELEGYRELEILLMADGIKLDV